mgnify:CR=1 FL=1
MAFATVSKSGMECLFNKKPIRKKDFWHPSVIGQMFGVMKNMKIYMMIG